MTQFVNIVLKSKFFPPFDNDYQCSITYEISFNATT